MSLVWSIKVVLELYPLTHRCFENVPDSQVPTSRSSLKILRRLYCFLSSNPGTPRGTSRRRTWCYLRPSGPGSCDLALATFTVNRLCVVCLR